MKNSCLHNSKGNKIIQYKNLKCFTGKIHFVPSIFHEFSIEIQNYCLGIQIDLHTYTSFAKSMTPTHMLLQILSCVKQHHWLPYYSSLPLPVLLFPHIFSPSSSVIMMDWPMPGAWTLNRHWLATWRCSCSWRVWFADLCKWLSIQFIWINKYVYLYLHK